MLGNVLKTHLSSADVDAHAIFLACGAVVEMPEARKELHSLVQPCVALCMPYSY